MVAASTIFARCCAAFRRAGVHGEALHKQLYLALNLPVGIKECLYNERDRFTGSEIQDMLQSARKYLVSRRACTRSRLPSRQRSKMTVADLMQLGVTS